MPIMTTPLEIDGNSVLVMRVIRGLSQRRSGRLAGVNPWRIFQIEHRLIELRENEVVRLLGVLTTGR